MTVDTTGGGAVAPYDDDFGSIGLEDVGAGDLVMPRISIDHPNGVFVNSLTKEEFPALTAVILGLVKQRVFWPDDLEDGDKPLCKSPDNTHGFPRVGDNIPKSKQFPWSQSNFSPTDMRTVDIGPNENPAYPEGWSSNGYGTLSCDACNFAKWGKNEDAKSVPPPCSEQHTYPLLYMADDGEGGTNWVPAILTVQRSAIKNSRTYINNFAQARQAMFTVYTGLSLTQESRGRVTYSVPNFKRMGPSDRNSWGEYAQQLRSIRSFIRSAPRRQGDSDDSQAAQSDNENRAPVAESSPQPSAPSAPPTPPAPPAPRSSAATAPPPPAPPTPPSPQAPSTTSVAPEDDDDLPF